MSGKALGVMLLLSALIAGAGLYYLQVYGFYREVPARPGEDVTLVALSDGKAVPIRYADFRAIDADSSPIRYRACFTTDMGLDELSAAFVAVEDIEPRNAPGWFDCFDTGALATALKDGTARAYLGGKNVAYGVDRIVAITEDGRGFVWHDLNECGDKAYDGTVIGEACPPRPETN